MMDAETDSFFTIRNAEPADLPALVKIHVTSWNATYPTYEPRPTVGLREHQWRKAFAEKEDNWFCYVVVNQDRQVVGFATGNDFYAEELCYEGQLNKIHFLKPYHRLGLGRKLVSYVARHFLERGIKSMILFADPENPNIKFYDILKGERLLDKDAKFQGAFGWKDLHELAAM